MSGFFNFNGPSLVYLKDRLDTHIVVQEQNVKAVILNMDLYPNFLFREFPLRQSVLREFRTNVIAKDNTVHLVIERETVTETGGEESLAIQYQRFQETCKFVSENESSLPYITHL